MQSDHVFWRRLPARRTTVWCAALGLLSAACGADGGGKSVSLQRDVMPVLHTSCTFGSACHGAATTAGYMRLGPADAVSADELHAVLVGQPSVTEPNMPRIAPGEPANSFLLRKLRGDFAGLGCSPADCGRPMPFGAPPLPEQTIEMLERWITDGAPM